MLDLALKWRRNWKSLLSGTNNKIRENFVSRVGCPHCHPSERSRQNICLSCAWNTGEYKGQLLRLCLKQTFDGVFYSQSGVIYYDEEEDIRIPSTKQKLVKMIKFLRGHIEWANRVLENRWD